MSLKGRLGRWRELAASVGNWAEGEAGAPDPYLRGPASGGAAPVREGEGWHRWAAGSGEGETPGASRFLGPGELAAALEGAPEYTDAGPAVLVKTRFHPEQRHGRRPLSAFRDTPLDGLVGLGAGPSALRGPAERAVGGPPGFAPEDVLFWDTETSGLAGGAGSFVIMAGFGRFTPAGFTVRQYVLPHPGGPEEEAFLKAAVQELTAARVLISFNGKAFDGYQLENRLILAGMSREARGIFRGIVHVDLLHMARMLYRHHLPSCSLDSLEGAVLGYVRSEDIPGSEVPRRYAAYLDSASPHHLLPVLRHNRDDVLSLVALATRVGHLMARAQGPEPRTESGMDGLDGRGASPWPGELYGLARLHALRGCRSTAIRLYRQVLTSPDRAAGHLRPGSAAGARGPAAGQAGRGGLPPELRRRAALDLADLYRRDGRWRRAEQVWREVIARDRLSFGAGPPCCRPHIELAKLLEHRRKDPRAALELVDEAIALLRRPSAANFPGPAPARQMADLLHRRRRLASKAALVS